MSSFSLAVSLIVLTLMLVRDRKLRPDPAHVRVDESRGEP